MTGADMIIFRRNRDAQVLRKQHTLFHRLIFSVPAREAGICISCSLGYACLGNL